MPLSLKSHLKKFVHKGQITQEEHDALIKKLDGHDREIRSKAIDEFAEKLKTDFMDYDLYLILHANNLMKPNESMESYRKMVDEIAEQLKESK